MNNYPSNNRELNSQTDTCNKSSSWLISFGDLLTLLVCFFLSIISLSNFKKESKLLETPVVSESKSMFHGDFSAIGREISNGTLLADKKVSIDEKASLSEPITISFDEVEFEGSNRRLSMSARRRLKLAIELDAYKEGDLIISSCVRSTGSISDKEAWSISRLQASELKRQLIDSGWGGAEQEIRMQILGKRCQEIDSTQHDRPGMNALITINRDTVSNG